MSKILKCECGEELIFNDNSICSVGYQCYPLYFCPKCHKVWNGFALEDEDGVEYIEETDEIYKAWFTKDVFVKIKYWYINDLEKKIQELDDIISRFN